jgi:CDP-diacylglycerol--serine O-phosphatidyltransferase
VELNANNQVPQEQEEPGVTFEVVELEAAAEDDIEKNRKTPRKGVYLLPNLLTTAALFCGFYAIIASVNLLFEKAAIALFAGMVFDGLDGRVARLTNTQSEFGAQYDSLADMVTFGVAPAMLIYSWSLSSIGKVGWMVGFIWVACAALRLARFNVQIGCAAKNYFTGLASPAAAATLASYVWLGSDVGIKGENLSILSALLAAILAGLMVSSFRYPSFKEFDLRGKVPFVNILLVVVMFAVIFSDPPKVLFVLFLGYTLFGLVGGIKRKFAN